MGKYYAVRKGMCPGIYTDWNTCRQNVIGYDGAQYKSFETEEEAIGYLEAESLSYEDINIDDLLSYAFVDGSFNKKTKVYGYGGFLCHREKDEDSGNITQTNYILKGNGNDEEMATMRNIAGELLGAISAMEKALSLGITDLSILYDYKGIESWATGEWKRNKEGTKEYHEFYNSIKDKINIHFIKVKAHSGIEGNELADELAKESVGL